MDEIDKAMSEVDDGNVSGGLRLLEEAESKAGDDEKFQIAQLYHQWGHVNRALTMIQELRQAYPEEDELTLLQAELLMDQGDEEEALDLLADMDTSGENGPRVLLLLADIYAAQGIDEVAEQKLLEAKRTVPDEPVVTLALAEFYFSNGDYHKSIPHYEKLLQEGDTFAGRNINLRLGEALGATGYFEDALPYYEQGTKEDADSDGLFAFGVTAYRAGNTEMAIRVLADLKEKDPDYAKLYLYLMKAYLDEGATDESLQTAEEGLKVDAFNEDLAFGAGYVALEQGRTEDAEAYFKKTLDTNPLHHQALRSLAGLYSEQQRYEGVINLLDGIEDQEEQDRVFFWYLATAENNEELYNKAKMHYRQAFDGFADDPVFLEEYGDFLLEEGQTQEAVSLFKKALSIDPTFTHLEEKITHFEE